MKTRFLRATALVSTAILFAGAYIACATEPLGTAEAGIQAAKGGKPGPPPGAQDVPISVHSFTGGLSASASTTGQVLSDGRLWVVTTDRICVDFTQDLVIDSEPDWDEFKQLSGQDPANGPICSSDVTLHTRDHSNDGKMLGEFAGIEYAGGKVAFKDFPSSSKSEWEWRVIFDTWRGQGDATPVGEGVCIEQQANAPSARQWLISNDCTANDGTQVDGQVEFWRIRPRVGKTPGEIVLVATFTMPFSFVVTEQP
jgi:hypothetical protein